MTNTKEEKFCYRKGAFCFEHATCTGSSCFRNLSDYTKAISVEPALVDVGEPVLMGTTVIADDGGFTNYYTQAYVDELKQERDKYKELYETMYRKYSELDTKDLNKKYAEAIAKDYLNKNVELVKQNEELSKLIMAYHGQTIKPVTVEIIYEFLKSNTINIEIPHGSEPAEEDVLGVMWWQIAKYFKEKFNIGDYKDE
jgi:hypothetical protein